MKKLMAYGLAVTVLVLGASHAGAAEKKEDRFDALEKRISSLEKGDTGPASTSDHDMHSSWKDGVNLIYDKDGIKIQFGGLIQNDWLWMTGDRAVKDAFGTFDAFGNGPKLDDGTEFRRARLYMAGLLYDHVNFKGEFDFATGAVELKDVWIGLTALPYVGNIKVGHFKEPFGLEQLTSDSYTTFLERALPDAFVPARNTGVAMHNHINERFTWAVGAFRDTNDQGMGFGDHEYNVSARMTALPIWADDGKTLVHLGFDYSFRNPTNDLVRFRTRPEAHMAPFFLDTRQNGNDLFSQGVQLVDAEAAFVFGPFSMQGEWIGAFLQVEQGPGGSQAQFQGWYVQASYFLTGESRPYKTDTGTFSYIKPKKVFMDGSGGCGAWEIAARYSYMDLNDQAFLNGRLEDWTLGANWYLNPNTRVMFNYTLADPDPNGIAHLFQTRIQLFI